MLENNMFFSHFKITTLVKKAIFFSHYACGDVLLLFEILALREKKS